MAFVPEKPKPLNQMNIDEDEAEEKVKEERIELMRMGLRRWWSGLCSR